MQQYIIRRLILAIPTVIGATLIIFLIMRVVPGDVIEIIIGDDARVSEEQKEELREALGLNQPLPVQYLVWLGDVLRLDPGNSLVTRAPIIEEFGRRLPVTIQLGVGAILISLLLAIPAGVFSAVKQDTWGDYLVRVISIGGLSIPNFWIATMMILLFGMYLNWLPPIEYKSLLEDPVANITQMIWPMLIVGYSYSAIVSRMTRSSMLETLREDYVRTARSKGLREYTVITRHVLRNAILPVVTISANQMGFVISGSVIMETVFVLPGVGSYIVNAIHQRDYPVIQFAIALIAMTHVFINLITDISYAVLDPRIRYS